VPWKAKRPVDLKMEFIARLRRGERMAELCREYGISRKTGHKLKKRVDQLGAAGLEEQSRAPLHIPHKTPLALVEVILAEKRQHPNWGAKKLKDVLERRLGHAFPAASTVQDLLLRNGLVEVRKRRPRYTPQPTTLRQAQVPNDVWCIDYKGQFRLGDQSYCYPLTVTDQHSRFLLGCEGMAAISDEAARDVCAEIFQKNGLPLVMRSDNGVPFASTGLAGLTKLSAYWLRLGIALERIRPAHPEENGQHERMHRTLKRETTRPARANLLQQQERFDLFLEEFNVERPHEALGMKRPAEVYQPSPRPCPGKLPELTYPTYDDVLQVSRYGDIYLPRQGQVRLTPALADQQVGVRELDDGRWLVSFVNIDLGHFGPGRGFTPITSTPPEATKVLPMCPV
jgi:transposase InsO family protein